MIPRYRAWFDSEMYDKPVVYDGEFYLDWREFENGETYNGAVLMQSTGLFDKNGKEIFEGDIIVAMSQGVKAIGEVKRRIDGYWLMYPAWQHGELWHIVENVDTGETGVEVIGNIYENPELVDELE